MPAFAPRRPLRALFVHRRFPAQFGHLAPALAERVGVQVVSLGETDVPRLPGVRHLHYGATRGAGEQTHHYLKPLEEAVRRGQAVAKRLLEAKEKQGLSPDLIVCHGGWGEALYLKDIFPAARTLHYCEFYHHGTGQDVGFEPGRRPGVDDLARVRTLNATQLLSLQTADWGFTPTAWQRSRYPDWVQRRISVVHEGIDTGRCAPQDGVRFRTPAGQEFRKGDEVISFAARHLDTYRGLQSFLGALTILQKERPGLHAVVAGGDEVAHGARPLKAASWREELLDAMAGQLDLGRIHFTGMLAQDSLHALFRVSAGHVYLTYPFVLSWSVLEAMACGAVVVGSDTPPVAEVIAHGENGLLVPFWDPPAIAAAVLGVLKDPAGHAHLGVAARETIRARYDLHSICLPRQLDIIERVAAGEEPATP